MTIRDLCEQLRPSLKPCPNCGAEWRRLAWHTWHVGCGAHVYCSECSYGTPAKHISELIVNNGDHEAVTDARNAWNDMPRNTP